MIIAALIGQMVGGFIGRLLGEYLFRKDRVTAEEVRDQLEKSSKAYMAGFGDGYRMAKREADNEAARMAWKEEEKKND